MGYLKKNDTSPHGPVSWVEKENSFIHPFSLKKRAFDYGFHQIKDVMPLDVYLDMPVDILDDIIEGIREGAEERMKQTPKTPEDKNKDPLLEYLSGQLNKS